jgi:hypothetical protein
LIEVASKKNKMHIVKNFLFFGKTFMAIIIIKKPLNRVISLKAILESYPVIDDMKKDNKNSPMGRYRGFLKIFLFVFI